MSSAEIFPPFTYEELKETLRTNHLYKLMTPYDLRKSNSSTLTLPSTKYRFIDRYYLWPLILTSKMIKNFDGNFIKETSYNSYYQNYKDYKLKNKDEMYKNDKLNSFYYMKELLENIREPELDSVFYIAKLYERNSKLNNIEDVLFNYETFLSYDSTDSTSSTSSSHLSYNKSQTSFLFDVDNVNWPVLIVDNEYIQQVSLNVANVLEKNNYIKKFSSLYYKKLCEKMNFMDEEDDLNELENSTSDKSIYSFVLPLIRMLTSQIKRPDMVYYCMTIILTNPQM